VCTNADSSCRLSSSCSACQAPHCQSGSLSMDGQEFKSFAVPQHHVSTMCLHPYTHNQTQHEQKRGAPGRAAGPASIHGWYKPPNEKKERKRNKLVTWRTSDIAVRGQQGVAAREGRAAHRRGRHGGDTYRHRCPRHLTFQACHPSGKIQASQYAGCAHVHVHMCSAYAETGTR
jgi:hypothetical protein